MTREQFLKKEILKKYKSLRQFAIEVGIAPSTLTTILNSGVGGTAIDTMFNICDTLRIGIENFRPNADVEEPINEIGLNEIGVKKVKDYIDDLKNNPKYTVESSASISDDITNELKQDTPIPTKLKSDL